MSEYRVNPHIRNKQTLDMDLVLVCEKKMPSPVTSLPAPADILRQTISELDSPSSCSDNKLFLHFMGKLLQIASAMPNGALNYNWFADALAHFDDFLQAIRTSRQRVEYTPSSPRQRCLLEGCISVWGQLLSPPFALLQTHSPTPSSPFSSRVAGREGSRGMSGVSPKHGYAM